MGREGGSDGNQDKSLILGQRRGIRHVARLDHSENQVRDAEKKRESDNQRDAREPYEQAGPSTPQLRRLRRGRRACGTPRTLEAGISVQGRAACRTISSDR